jgi:double-stranded uracil-DNA glycosylase
MGRLRGFPPAGAQAPRFLILGSFPSASSLEKGEYYGHERNHFWVLLGLILGFDAGQPYAERLSRLAAAGIALWDLIGSCEREGSLDRDILEEEPNPLHEYIGLRPSIERIGLNGGKAAASFISHLAKGIPAKGLAIGEILSWRFGSVPERLILVSRLPSTSPVPTRDYRRAADKLPHWSAFLA